MVRFVLFMITNPVWFGFNPTLSGSTSINLEILLFFLMSLWDECPTVSSQDFLRLLIVIFYFWRLREDLFDLILYGFILLVIFILGTGTTIPSERSSTPLFNDDSPLWSGGNELDYSLFILILNTPIGNDFGLDLLCSPFQLWDYLMIM